MTSGVARTSLQIFIILGIAVNCGGNTDHHYIGGHNWFIGDAPFVGGIGGFASVFVTAAFACENTLSSVIQSFDSIQMAALNPSPSPPAKPKIQPV